MADDLTKASYWENVYQKRGNGLTFFDDKDWRNSATIEVMQKILSLISDGDKVLEIGGGGGETVCYLASKKNKSFFNVIDFSSEGCALADLRAKKDRLKVSIFQSDFFNPPQSMCESFDLVYSFGVVEHFFDLSKSLKAKSFFLKKDGKMLTLIPNMASPIYSYFTGKWDKDVLDTHVPYTLKDLKAVIDDSDMTLLEAGYFSTVEFGILSMATLKMSKKSCAWHLFVFLTRISKIVHLLAKIGIRLPKTALFSPYIYTISQKKPKKPA